MRGDRESSGPRHDISRPRQSHSPVAEYQKAACHYSRSKLLRVSCINICLKRNVAGVISSLVLVSGQKVSCLSAAGGHKLNAIAKINDFQMICHLFPEPIRWSSLGIEFGNMRKRKIRTRPSSCTSVND